MRHLNNWLRGIKILLWLSIAGFGLTLFNAARLAVTSDEIRAEVSLTKRTSQTSANGTLQLNSGTYLFKSDNFLDKLIFRHTYGNWDLPQSLFTFVCCCILLYTVNGINGEGPFTVKTANRIRSIGLLFIAYSLINIALAYYMRDRISQLISGVDYRYITFPGDLTYLKSGVFILIFSLIYRVGVVYQDENQLTI